MIQAAKATAHVLLLAAVCLPAFANIPRTSLVAEKPHLGVASFALPSHRAESVANTLIATGFGGCLYDSSTRPCCSGKERDAETGLDYFGARYHSGAQGRFISPDPFNPILEFQPKGDEPNVVDEARQAFDSYLANPQHWNRYTYGLNNPYAYVDKDGRIPVLVAAWAAYEIGSAIYDAYTAYKTVRDPNASQAEKSIAVAGLGASILLPGGGYGTSGKQVAKEILEASGAQMHHIATNKNILGGFTKQFEKVFNAAGLSLDDGINKIILRGHANNRHTPQYHQYVLDRLTKGTQGLKSGSQQYRTAVTNTLEELRRELLDNPGMIGWTNFP